MKYNNNFRAGIFLGKKIAERFLNEIVSAKYDFIIPVPLHPLKKAERGYNQSYYIAKGISQITKIKIGNNIVKRKRYTSTQTKLSAIERKENIRNAFTIKKIDKIRGKKIILVDDVTTTGATVTEVAKKLKKIGVSEILLLTAAIPKIEIK